MKYDKDILDKLIGQKFHKLEVISYQISETGRQIICTAQCECGTPPKDYPLYLLANGNNKSCGCSRHLKKKPIIGKRFESLTILSEDEETGDGTVKCDCGNEFSVKNIRTRVYSLKKQGVCKECLNKKNESKRKYDNIKPKTKFNQYTVIRRVENTLGNQATYECRCSCGTIKNVLGKYLMNENVKSCGCLKSNNFKKVQTLRGITSSEVGKTLYSIWKYNLNKYKKECNNKNIKFFPEWDNELNAFISFYNWATLKKDGFSKDSNKLLRINENKDFSTKNCYFTSVQKAK